MWVVYIILAFSAIGFYYYYTRDALHPCLVLLAVWLLTCAMSCVDMDTFIKPWCTEMYVVTILSAVSLFIGSLFFIRKTDKRIFMKKEPVSYSYTVIVRTLFVVCLGCYLLEWYKNGMPIALTLNESDGDVKAQLSEGISGIHYGTIFLLYTAVLTYYRYLNAEKKSLIDILIIGVILVISMVFKISRGDLMILIFSFLFLYSRYHRIKFSSVVIAIALLFGAVVGLMLMRVHESSIIMNMTDNPLFSIVYSYIATCYANLNDFIMADYPWHPLGNATFAPLWTLTGLKESMEVIEVEQLDVFNARTYIYGFYHDFKIIGIIVFPFLIGMGLSLIYYNATYGRPLWNVLLATLQKAVFVPFFGNYFFGEMVILFPYLLTLLIILFVFNYNIKPPFKRIRIYS